MGQRRTEEGSGWFVTPKMLFLTSASAFTISNGNNDRSCSQGKCQEVFQCSAGCKEKVDGRKIKSKLPQIKNHGGSFEETAMI